MLGIRWGRGKQKEGGMSPKLHRRPVPPYQVLLFMPLPHLNANRHHKKIPEIE